eukprot:TRINITY_DN277_c6_g1_i1.p3 TRINITY_DN277_c6_g1~~TRINITY_DN277_c6_g1_i1.p3  ORF type:complete len:112 (-),score=12.51 TRINITY_DN277_c6_g1_i1:990-1325(-)
MFQLKNFFSSSSRDVGGSRGSTPRGEQQRKKGGREAGGARDTNGALADIDKLDITHITSRVIGEWNTSATGVVQRSVACSASRQLHCYVRRRRRATAAAAAGGGAATVTQD